MPLIDVLLSQEKRQLTILLKAVTAVDAIRWKNVSRFTLHADTVS